MSPKALRLSESRRWFSSSDPIHPQQQQLCVVPARTRAKLIIHSWKVAASTCDLALVRARFYQTATCLSTLLICSRYYITPVFLGSLMCVPRQDRAKRQQNCTLHKILIKLFVGRRVSSLAGQRDKALAQPVQWLSRLNFSNNGPWRHVSGSRRTHHCLSKFNFGRTSAIRWLELVEKRNVRSRTIAA